MPYQTLTANSDNPELSDGDDATADGPGVALATLTDYSGGTPTAITVNFRARANDDPATIDDIIIFAPGLDMALANQSFVIPQDSVTRDYEAVMDFVATPTEIRDALLTPNVTSLQFLYPTFQNVFITELSVRVDWSDGGLFPLRRYPPVNNGGSGPTRHYPRAVNRRAGGTY